MNAVMIRYRVMAYVVGALLLVLVFVAMPLKYLAGEPALVEAIGPVHGFLYIVYLVVTFDLARKSRWRLGTTVAALLAGTVPFLSFVMERKVTSRL